MAPLINCKNRKNMFQKRSRFYHKIRGTGKKERKREKERARGRSRKLHLPVYLYRRSCVIIGLMGSKVGAGRSPDWPLEVPCCLGTEDLSGEWWAGAGMQEIIGSFEFILADCRCNKVLYTCVIRPALLDGCNVMGNWKWWEGGGNVKRRRDFSRDRIIVKFWIVCGGLEYGYGIIGKE